jgi:hypothetical protein
MTNNVKVNDKLEITNLTVTDPQVIAAAKTIEADGRDLAEYIIQAIEVGNKVLLTTGISLGVEVLAEEINKTNKSMKEASQTFGNDLAERISKATGEDGPLVAAINSHIDEFVADLEKMTGGEDSPIRKALKKQLEDMATKLTNDIARSNSVQKMEIQQYFNMDNPSSPINKIGNEVKELASVINEVREKINQDVAVGEIISNTTLGGLSYEDAAVSVLQQIANVAGDDCEAVGHVTGRISKSKKGDAVVDLKVGATVYARVVAECKDSALSKKLWEAEIEGAKANRSATGFIGFCKNLADMPNKSRMQVIDAQTIIVAYDPAIDDAQVLHLIYQVVKFNTLRNTGTLDGLDMASINQGLEDAVRDLELFDDINKQGTAIMNAGEKIKKDAKKIRDNLAENLENVRRAISKGLAPAQLETLEPLALTNEATTDEEGEEA